MRLEAELASKAAAEKKIDDSMTPQEKALAEEIIKAQENNFDPISAIENNPNLTADEKLAAIEEIQKSQNLGNVKTKKIIASNKFDIVVIQDNSMWPLEHKDSVLNYGRLFCNYIRANGAKPYLYNTWAREKTPQTQSSINAVYNELAAAENAVNVSVGSSFDLARKTFPNMNLFHPDGSHPSAVGTFLIALSFIKKITGTLPKKYATVYNYFDKDGETFRIMQLTDAEIESCVSIVNSVIQ
jgi:hypothetical protein